MANLFSYRTRVEREVKRRINLAVWAYAYEFDNNSLVSDHTYDMESKKVDLTISTSRPDLDEFFRADFNDSSGIWIHSHPELDKVVKIYNTWYKPRQQEMMI